MCKGVKYISPSFGFELSLLEKTECFGCNKKFKDGEGEKIKKQFYCDKCVNKMLKNINP